MSTDAGGTAAPVTPLHPTLAGSEPTMHDAPELPIEIVDDDPYGAEMGEDHPFALHELLLQADGALTAAHRSIEVNEEAIAAAAGNPHKYHVPLQVAALEHSMVSAAASQIVIARALLKISERLERIATRLESEE